jgi:hypothetical protein
MALGDTPYYGLLQRIHEELAPRTYIEIGVRLGDSLRLAGRRTMKIGVDPEAKLQYPFDRDTTAVFEMTSDDFFAEHDVREILGGRPVDLAFVDGMHLFEFALRDFMNIERHCVRDSLIIVHDCIPIDAITSERVRQTSVWTGDVWKLVPVLKRLRPDLHIVTSDIGPSGLALITNLDPSSTVLRDHLDAAVDEFMDVDYDAIAADKDAALNVSANAWEEVRELLSDAIEARTAPLDVADDAFCTLAFVDEIAAAPALLAAYAEHFAGEERATLLLRADGGDAGATVARLEAAIAASGIEAEAGPDLLLIDAAVPTDAVLARRAGALLSERDAPAALAGHARVGAPDAAALAELAVAGRGVRTGV